MTTLNSLAEAAQKLYDGGYLALASKSFCASTYKSSYRAWKPHCCCLARTLPALENLRTAE